MTDSEWVQFQAQLLADLLALRATRRATEQVATREGHVDSQRVAQDRARTEALAVIRKASKRS